MDRKGLRGSKEINAFVNVPHSQPHATAALPLPDPATLAHSARLSDQIRDEILAAGGSIGFRRFMDCALYAPGLGYYNAGAAKFGPAGDFVTAPELSPLFSTCLARQCEEILQLAGGDLILELGAGSGRMATDLLRELIARGNAPREYWILETSAGLRKRQRQRLARELPEFAARIRWLDRLPEGGVRGVILANEVLDAIPVCRVRLSGRRVMEMRIAWEGARFEWRCLPADAELDGAVQDIVRDLGAPLPDGYVTEVNMSLRALIERWAGALTVGALVLLDYGYPRREYFHPQRGEGTLLCHYRHRVHADPLLYPGLQDISAAVDFTAVAEAGAGAGLDLGGFTTQAHFLIGCGLEEIASRQSSDDTRRWLEVAQQVKVLTLPGEMGELVKAIAFTRNLPSRPLKGFASFDQRPRL
ncbi:MAG: SAM-dependent methyltransferase [Gammaproteobacteria bacterium]|nr:SAM-dependent methyltransferase [Gammaproteobacteria bacterium]